SLIGVIGGIEQGMGDTAFPPAELQVVIEWLAAVGDDVWIHAEVLTIGEQPGCKFLGGGAFRRGRGLGGDAPDPGLSPRSTKLHHADRKWWITDPTGPGRHTLVMQEVGP